MNCCDYNCHQGHNCPARATPTPRCRRPWAIIIALLLAVWACILAAVLVLMGAT